MAHRCCCWMSDSHNLIPITFTIYSFSKKKTFIYLFIYVWLCWVFAAARTSSSCEERELLSSHGACAPDCGGSLGEALSLWGTWASGAAVPGLQSKAQLWQPVGLAAPPHLGSSWTRVRTRVSCIGKEILYHRASRETSLLTPPSNFFSSEYISKATAHLIIQNRIILSEKGCCL